MLQKAGWFEFLMMFHGHNLQVARAFALSFDGKSADIGDVMMHIDEALIARATNLPLKGEQWFKTKRVRNIPWSEFLVSPKQSIIQKVCPHPLSKRNGNFFYG
jgi:hypothetical protein